MVIYFVQMCKATPLTQEVLRCLAGDADIIPETSCKISLNDVRVLEQQGNLSCKAEDGSDVHLIFTKPANVTSGLNIRKFFDEGWDKDYYYESDFAEVQLQDDDGNWLLEDDKDYDLSHLGGLAWQGYDPPRDKPKELGFEEAFLKWKTETNG